MKTMTVLHVNTTVPRVVFETNRGGEIIPSEESRTINICIRNELKTERGAIAFHAIVKVNKTTTTDEKVAETLAVDWLKAELPKRFAKPTYWNFFEHTALLPSQLPEIVSGDVWQPSTDGLELSPALVNLVNEALDHIARVKAKFEGAKERLRYLATTNSPLGFSQTKGEAYALLRTVEGTLQASADVGGHEPHKARSAMRDYEELSHRKIELNHSYQSTLQSLKSFAHGVSFPSTWGRRPDA